MARGPCPGGFPWLGRAGCSVCLAAGRRHSLPWLCPLSCRRGCHMCCLLDIRCCASSADPGQAGFMPDPSAALTCSLCCRALFFQLWARGWGVSPAPHQHGQCLLGLLWVSLQDTGDQQPGTAGRGNLHIRYPPCFLPEGKCFEELAQSPVPDAGSGQASLACIEGPGTGHRRGCSTGRGKEAGPSCASLGRCASVRGVAGRERQSRTRVIPKDHSEGCILTWDL